MKYKELCKPWQRVFELDWLSLCEGSKAIAAVIVSDTGEIISEGRNRVNEDYLPNNLVAHAELEAISQLDITRYSFPKTYTLYAALEPCPMCLGTIVMGHIRKVIIAASDRHGGAMELLSANDFLRNKNIKVEWAEPLLGKIQIAMQAIRELLMNNDEERMKQTIKSFSVRYPESVKVAAKLVDEGFINYALKNNIPFEVVFNRIAKSLL